MDWHQIDVSNLLIADKSGTRWTSCKIVNFDFSVKVKTFPKSAGLVPSVPCG